MQEIYSFWFKIHMINSNSSILDKVSLNGKVKLHNYSIVKNYGNNIIKVITCNTVMTGNENNKKYKPEQYVNDKKLDNNISRAKSKVQEYALLLL